jgi:hypothetical protein
MKVKQTEEEIFAVWKEYVRQNPWLCDFKGNYTTFPRGTVASYHWCQNVLPADRRRKLLQLTPVNFETQLRLFNKAVRFAKIANAVQDTSIANVKAAFTSATETFNKQQKHNTFLPAGQQLQKEIESLIKEIIKEKQEIIDYKEHLLTILMKE